jgi:hypothetical protein
MYELLIKCSTPEEFKEGIKGLYRLFPDLPYANGKPGGFQTEAIPAAPHWPARDAESPNKLNAQ